LDYAKAKKDLLTDCSENCLKFFEHNGYLLEVGYYNLFKQELSKARENFIKVSDSDIRAHWGYFLTELLQGKISGYPSYFELRNFFEIDLDMLVKNYLGDYVQTLVNYSDFLSQFNSEINKYIARVFLVNGYKNYAKLFFQKAKDSFYNDPELHFLIAQTQFKEGDIETAQSSANTCLKILPEYWPAVKLLSDLS